MFKHIKKYAPKLFTFFLVLFIVSGLLYTPSSPLSGVKKAEATSTTSVAGTVTSTSAGTCNDADWTSKTAASMNANDTSYAQYTGTAFDNNDGLFNLNLSNFGFAITNGNVIDGITVETLGWSPSADGVDDSNLQLTKVEGTGVGSSYADATDYPTSDPGSTYRTYGTGTTDKWGTTWTEAEIENSGFGLTLCLLSHGANATFNMDHIRVTVHHRPPNTTLGNGSDPGSTAIAPGASVTDIDQFSFTTDLGSDTITALTVTLSSDPTNYVSQVDITDTSNVVRCTAVANPTSVTVQFNTCSSNGGVTASTGGNTYKVRITPKSHANMPAVPGASYSTTANITNWTGTNTHAGSDTAGTSVAIDNLSPGPVSTATPWFTQSAAVAGNNDFWNDVTYGNGIFVAVGDSTGSEDSVMTSSDGVTWAAQNAAGDDDQWNGVAYGNGIFVAVGSVGDRVMTSSNGTSWTARSAANNDDIWNSVTYGNGIFVAVGHSGDRVMTSSDGVTWAVQNAAGDNDGWQDITYGNGTFVAVGDGGGADKVMTSSNGTSWTAQSAANNDDNWYGVTYGNGTFVAVASGVSGDHVMTSSDGASWTAQSALGNNDTWKDVTYAAGFFVAVGSGSGDKVMTSPDGANWTFRSASLNDDNWNGITYSNGLFVAVGSGLTTDHVVTSGATVAEAGDGLVNLYWSNPSDADFTTSGTVVVLRRSAGAVNTTPTEGQTYSVGNTINTDNTVACVVTGSPPATTCQDTSLSNGTAYHYKIFTQDSRGNYDAGTVPSGSPATPVAIDVVLADGTDGGNSTIAPGASATEIDRFSLDMTASTDTVTGMTVTLAPAGAFNNIATVGVYTTGDSLKCESSSWGGDLTVELTSCGIAVDTNAIEYVVKITPKTHTNMPAVPGASYATTATVTSLTTTNGFTGTDTDSATITTDNLSPNGSVGVTWTARSAAGNDDGWESVAYGNGTFVAVGNSGDVVMTSTNGTSWTARSAAGDDDWWQAVTYGNGLFVAVGTKTDADLVMTSPDGITWTPRTAAEANSWNSVTYGNGLFVAVATSGTNRVMTSPDGITWTAESAAEANPWRGITYGNGMYVAVASLGTNRVMTSPDGETWTARSAVSNNDNWQEVVYGNGLFVAVATDGDRVMTSPDGTAWTGRTAAEANSWRSLTYGNGLFVAVTDSGTNRVMTSPDGITWISRSAAEANGWFSVTHGNETFVAVSNTGTNRAMTSPGFPASTATPGNTVVDLAWTNAGDADFDEVIIVRDTAAITAAPVEGTEYSVSGTIGGATVVVCNTASTSCQDSSLTNGTPYHYKIFSQDTNGNYDAGTVPTGSPATPVALTTTLGDGTDPGNSTVAPGGSVTDIDAFTLTTTSGTDTVTALTVTLSLANSYENLAKVEITDGSNVDECTDVDDPASITINFTGCSLLADADGESFKVRITPKSHANMPAPPGLGYEFTATVTAITATNSTAGTDTDSALIFVDNISPETNVGVDWTGQGDPTGGDDESWYGVTYGNGVYVAVGSEGDRVMTSPDGVTWTARNAAGNDDIWQDVAYGGGQFVAVGYTTDLVMTSPDGITWTARSAAGDDDAWQGITYANGLFVAVGSSLNSQGVMTSPDGITWTVRSAAENDDDWTDVTYANGIFVAVAASGDDRAMTSPDGITWTPQNAVGDNDSWSDVTYGNGLFVAVGIGSDYIMTSPDGETWTARSGDFSSWTSVVYAEGMFVALGTNNQHSMVSADGINWVIGDAVMWDSPWQAATYGGGKFVVVAADSTRVATGEPFITSGNGVVDIEWLDYTSNFDTDEFVILRHTSAISDVPTEGSEPTSGTIGSATIVCVTASTTCQDTGLSNGTAYHYKMFIQDTQGNYAAYDIAGSPVTPNLVTLGDGTDPGNSTIAPGASATDIDRFSLQTAAGTAPVQKLTVTLAPAGAFNYISKIEITDTSNVDVCTDVDNVGSLVVDFNNCSITATTSLTEYKVRITPKSHADMPAVPGAEYAITGTATSFFVDRAAITGTDTDSATITVDNLSPNNATSTSAAAGSAAITVDWTTSSGETTDAVLLRWQATTAGSEVPVEGATYNANDTITTATVACVITGQTTATALSKIDGTNGSAGCNTSALTNDQAYSYKVFHKDSNGNYDAGVSTNLENHTPAAAAVTTLDDGTDPGNSTIAPGASVTDIDAFTLQRNTGSTTVTDLTVTLSPANSFNNIAKVEITDGSDVDECTDIDNPASVTLNFTGCSLAVTTSSTPFKVRITPKAHASMPAVPGASYATTATVTAITVAAGTTAGTDTDSATITTDNLSPNAGAGVTWDPRSATEANVWVNVTYGGGKFVAVSTTGTNRVMYSSDGITWNTASAAEANPWNSVTYGNGQFVAVSTDGTNRVMTSPDGITWTARSAAAADEWSSVTYGNGLYVAVSYTGTVMTSPDGVIWTSRTAAEANSWNSVTYGNGTFVAVSNAGTNRVMTSTNGTSWTARSAAEANAWQTVTYGNGLFVAVSTNGTNQVMTSPTGETWTARPEAEANAWQSVTHANGQFVAVAFSGTNRVMTSPDGTTWTARAAAQANAWNSVTFGNGTLVAVSTGGSNRVMTSPGFPPATATAGNTVVDLAWTNAADADFDEVIILRHTSAIVAVPVEGTEYSVSNTIGSATVVCNTASTSCQDTSLTNNTDYHYKIFAQDTNGNYDTGTVPTGSPATPGVITLGDGTDPSNATIAPDAAATDIDRFSLAVGGGTDTVTALTVTLSPANSFNNISKVEITHTSDVDVCTDVDNPASVTVNFTGCTIPVTTSTVEYKVRITPKTHANMPGVPGSSYATTATVTDITATRSETGTDTDSATITTDNLSPNGSAVWTTRTAAEVNQWNSVAYGNGRFVAVASGGTNRVMYSDDGITWNSASASSQSEWTAVTYGEGLFAAIALDSTAIMTSPDGITWTPRTAPEAIGWSSITYGNGTFVAVASYGTNRVTTSDDGTTWTARSASEQNAWNGVTYGNGLFVAVAGSGTNRVMTSPDGITWTPEAAAQANQWLAVTYGNGLYVATAYDGVNRVMTSPDGETWTARTAAEDNQWRSVLYDNGLYVAVAGSGTNRVMVSADGINWFSRLAAATNSWTSIAYGEGILVSVSANGTVMSSPGFPPSTATAGDTVVDLAWTNASDADFDEVIILRHTAAITAAPTEGQEYSVTDVIGGSATVVCNTASTSCQDTSLSNGTAYHYKIFAQDTNGNYDSGTVPEGSPATPAVLQTTLGDGTDPGNSTVAPGAAVTDIDAFTLVRSTGSTTVTDLTVTLSPAGAFNNISKVEITDGSDVDECTDVDNPSSVTVNFTGCSLAVTTSSTPFKVRITPKTHANMPAVPGEQYATTATVTSITVSVGSTAGTDTDSATITTDNLSPDSTEPWTARSAAGNDDNWKAITYGNDKFVAVGYSGNRAMTSSDGISWTGLTGVAGDNDNWRSVVYANNTFVAVGWSGAIMTSPDGETWTARSGAEGDDDWNSVTYGNGTFVAVGDLGDDRVMTSTDGITWTGQSAAGNNDCWQGVTYGNGLFVAVGWCGNLAMTSTDGITWTGLTGVVGDNDSWYDVVYANGLFVAVGDAGDIVMTSPDGTTWTARSALGDNENWTDITYGSGLYVAVSYGFGERVMISPDGINWTARSAAGDNDGWYGVTYNDGQFVAVGLSGSDRVMTSSAMVYGTAAPGDTVVDLAWTNAGDADFDEVIIVRDTAAITAAPVEATEYSVSGTIGGSTVVVCNSASTSCQDTSLSNDTPYHYKIFTQDTNGNYDSGVVPAGSPATPQAPLTLTQGAYRIFENINGAVAFDTDGKLTGVGSSTGDYYTDTAKDSTYMYIASMDGSGDWRIEKRLLTTGALDNGFGSSGIATSSSGLRLDGIAIDDTYMYLVGEDSTPDWRIEKRKLSNGNLCTAGECGIQFGVSGVVTGDSSTIEAYTVVIDDTYMYVFGAGANNDWRTEKRHLSDGTLVSQFGVDGVLTHHSDTDYSLGDMAMGTDDTYMYLAGKGAGGTLRIEKRFLSHGALETDFGTNGVKTDSSITEPSGGDVLVDDTHIYFAGKVSGNTVHLEKRLKSTGALVDGFGGSGVQTLTTARVFAMTKDDAYIFLAGRDSTPDLTVEKRLVSDASTDNSFGTNGVVTSDSTTTAANSMVMDGGTLYIHGDDSNVDMRIEKRFKASGSLVDATKPAVGVPIAAENTAATLTATSGPQFRLRLLIHAAGSALSQDGETFKLQYAAKSGTCDVGFSGESYADITTGTPISFYDNSNLADGDTPSGSSYDPSDDFTKVIQHYEEANNFTNTAGAIPAGQDGLWDFALYDNGAGQGSSHCIRVVKSSGALLDSYTAIAEISTPAPALTQFGYIWRNDNGSQTGADYLLDRNIPLDKDFYAGDNRRLRIGISNTGNATATSTQYRLEYASDSCSAWAAVPNSAGGEPWTMVSSGNVSNGAATTDSAPLRNPSNKTFVAGQVMTTSNTTSGITLTPSQFTEVEYNIEPTSNVEIGMLYCFRITNAGSATGFTYSQEPKAKAFSFVFVSRGGGGGAAGGEGSGSGEQQGGGGAGGGGGGGTTATGNATVADGAVTGVNMTNGGTYSSPPTVAFCPNGSGSGATGTAVLTGNAVTSVTINNGGSNYSTAPSVLFGGTCGGGAGGGGGGDSGALPRKNLLATSIQADGTLSGLLSFLIFGFSW